MAATKLIQTNELLEQILLHLPIQDIFNARTICHHWKHLIETSHPLKKVTFRARLTNEILTLNTKPNLYFLQPKLKPGKRIITSGIIYPSVLPKTKIIVNDFAKDPDRSEIEGMPWTDWQPRTTTGSLSRNVPDGSIFNFVIPRLIATAVEKSFLRGMYLTKPPSPVFCVGVSSRKEKATTIATVRDDSGVTLGCIIEAYQKMLPSIHFETVDDLTFVAAFREESPRTLTWEQHPCDIEIWQDSDGCCRWRKVPDDYWNSFTYSGHA